MTFYISFFLVSFLISLFLVPYFARIARKYNALDVPTHRKKHGRIVPLWGGLPIYVSFIVSLLLAGLVSSKIFKFNLLGIVLGSTFILLIGLIDDKFGVPVKIKLFAQIIAGIILISSGIRMAGFTIPLVNMYIQIPTLISAVITIGWIVLITNAINFIDGLDGLAAGVSIISLIAFFIISFISLSKPISSSMREGYYISSIFSIILIGATSAFLIFNFYPAKVFLGDSGSMFLGYIISSISIIGFLKSIALITLLIPIMIMALPLFDIIYAILRRIKTKQPISKPDRKHLHHQLIQAGFSHPSAVIFLYSISAIFSFLAVIISI
jgi:UDP-GlcNAc:undecaprenyl-phosphate GlcNAc-1-phosphate transferase